MAVLKDLSPKERYLWICLHERFLLEHVPLKYVASYIGITPQTLSKMRESI